MHDPWSQQSRSLLSDRAPSLRAFAPHTSLPLHALLFSRTKESFRLEATTNKAYLPKDAAIVLPNQSR
eukprot:3285826-Amphidinium_carterae.2